MKSQAQRAIGPRDAARKSAADTIGPAQFNARWMVEITYNNDRPALIFTVSELEDIDEIVEQGPDWRTIGQSSTSSSR